MALQLFALFQGFGSWKSKTKEENQIPVIHKNDWFWGTTYTFIFGSGKSIIKLTTENDVPGIGVLSGFSVLPCYTGKGLGKQTLEFTVSYARGLGLESLEISVERLPGNEWIVDWYKRIGFVEFLDNDPDYINFRMNLRDEGDEGNIKEGKTGDTSET